MTSAPVRIGSVLLIRELQTGEECEKIKIVKSQQSHERNGRQKRQQIEDDEERKNGYVVISDASPLGRALLGRERGEIVTIQAPAGVFTWEIVEIFD